MTADPVSELFIYRIAVAEGTPFLKPLVLSHGR